MGGRENGGGVKAFFSKAILQVRDHPPSQGVIHRAGVIALR